MKTLSTICIGASILTFLLLSGVLIQEAVEQRTNEIQLYTTINTPNNTAEVSSEILETDFYEIANENAETTAATSDVTYFDFSTLPQLSESN